MARRRSSPALFELLADPSAQAQPAQTQPQTGEAGEKPAAQSLNKTPNVINQTEADADESQTLTIRTIWVPFIVFGMLLLVLGTWSIAWQRGKAAAESEWRQLTSGMNTAQNPIHDPLTQLPGESETDSNTNRQPNTTQTIPANSVDQILLPDGSVGADPRIQGNNYLALANLKRDQAAAAIEFLRSRGVQAIGVPIDRRAKRANNRASYRIYTLVGISGEAFSRSRALRDRHVSEVARLGQIWVREAGGASDFAKTQWEKYTP